MEHEKLRELLSDHHDGLLHGEERAAVEAHLPSCEACRAELDAYRLADRLIRAAAPQPARLQTEAFAAAVLRRVEPVPAYMLDRVLTTPRWAVPAFALAGLGVLFALRPLSVEASPADSVAVDTSSPEVLDY